ncbi:MAG: hypothetical protein AAGF84_07300 [Planctomycetota bacterium]
MNRLAEPTSRPSTATLLGAFVRRTGKLAVPAAIAVSFAGPGQAADRNWQGGNNDWADNGATSNWAPNDEPDSDDRAIFSTVNNTVNMITGNVINGLIVEDGTDLLTNNNFLDVNGDITLNGGGNGTNLTVGDNGIAGIGSNLLDAFNITINDGADLRVGGTRVDYADSGADVGVIDINAGGTLYGNGTVRNGDGITTVTSVIINDGAIEVGNVGGLIIIGGAPTPRELLLSSNDPDARIDLDGTSGNGIVRVFRNQTLDNNLQLSDGFGGTIELFQESVLDMEDPWSMDGGLIDVDNGFIAGTPPFIPNTPAGTAFIQGGTFTQTGGLIDVVDSDGTIQFDAATVFNGGTLDVSSGGTVIYAANGSINNGHTHTMGTNGQAVVTNNAILTVNKDDFNMDGNGGADWTIRNGAELNIRGDAIDTSDNEYNGTLTFQDDDNSTATGGDQILDINVASNLAQLNRIIVNSGTARIQSNANDNLQLQGLVTIDAGARLVLDSNSIEFNENGAVNGNGLLFFDEPVNIDDDTTITVSNLDIDNSNGSLTVSPGATLDLNATTISNIGTGAIFLINGGTADVSTASYNIVNTGELRFVESGAGAVNPTYVGAGTVNFLTGAELNNFSDGATLDSDAVFQEGSQIINNGANAVLNLTSSGETVTLAGGDISQTAAGSIVNTAGGGTLRVTGDSMINVTEFDFDQGGTILETGGILDLDVGGIEGGANADQYDSTLTFEGGRLEMNITAGNNTWTMDGNIVSTGGGTIIGDRMLVGDDVGTSDANITVNGTGSITQTIEAPVTFNSDADVFVGAGDTLLINNASTIFTPRNGSEDAEFTGTGTLRVVGAQFDEVTTLNMTGGTVGLDGALGSNGGLILLTPGDTDINNLVTINAATFDPFGFSNFAGASEINIADTARLTVNIDGDGDWQVLSSGIINYNGNGIESSFLAGDRLDLDGTLNVNGDGQILNPISIGGTVNILTAGEFFELEADGNLIDGGTINGPGVLQTGFSDDLTGNGTINADIDFSTGSILRAQDGLLDVNGAILDVGSLRTSGGAAVFDLGLALDTSVTETGLLLDGGRFQGATITLAGGDQIQGAGRVLNRVVNNGTLRATSGALSFENFSNDYDGSTENGRLNATAGTLVLQDNVNQAFSGVATIQSGGTIDAQGFALNMDTGSTLEFLGSGGSFIGSNGTQFRSTVNVASTADGTIGLGGLTATFTSTANGTIDGDLFLNTTSRFNNGASFTGTGSIVNFTNELMTLDGGVDLGVTLTNDGDLELGTGTQSVTATVGNYDGDGTLNIDIDGLGLNESDTLVVDSILSLQEAGDELDLSFNGFAPSLGNLFTIATASSVLGQYDTVSVSGLDPALDVDVLYNASSIVVEIIAAAAGIPGDYDDSGLVEQTDLNLVLTNWGDPRPFSPNGAPFATNIVDQEELNRVLSNWGATAAPIFGSFSVPEPGAAAVAIGLAGLALRRRRVA